MDVILYMESKNHATARSQENLPILFATCLMKNVFSFLNLQPEEKIT